MAYTDAQKSEMYASSQEELTAIVIKLQNFVDDADSEQVESEDVSFAQSTANQLSALIGQFAVRVKRCEKE